MTMRWGGIVTKTQSVIGMYTTILFYSIRSEGLSTFAQGAWHSSSGDSQTDIRRKVAEMSGESGESQIRGGRHRFAYPVLGETGRLGRSKSDIHFDLLNCSQNVLLLRLSLDSSFLLQLPDILAPRHNALSMPCLSRTCS